MISGPCKLHPLLDTTLKSETISGKHYVTRTVYVYSFPSDFLIIDTVIDKVSITENHLAAGMDPTCLQLSLSFLIKHKQSLKGFQQQTTLGSFLRKLLSIHWVSTGTLMIIYNCLFTTYKFLQSMTEVPWLITHIDTDDT